MKVVKKCAQCKLVKPLAEYQKDKQQRLGYKPYCKLCSNLRVRKTYEKTKPMRLLSISKYHKQNPERARLTTKKMYELYPEKQKARTKLAYEIRVGRITRKPCVICGEVKSQGHHEDYKKPLDVIWLCEIHHKQIHRKYA